MKSIVSVADASGQLPRLVREARNGKEVILTEQDQPVVRLVPIQSANDGPKPQARFGSAKGLILYMAPDFDAPIDDFSEYME